MLQELLLSDTMSPPAFKMKTTLLKDRKTAFFLPQVRALRDAAARRGRHFGALHRLRGVRDRLPRHLIGYTHERDCAEAARAVAPG